MLQRWLAGIVLVLACSVAGGVGSFLWSRHRAAQDEALWVEGRTLYAVARKTEPGYRPFKLLHELYARAEDKGTVLEFMALKPGLVVADIGCGAGYYTLDLARQVGPTGRVHALDIQESAVDFLRERLDLIGCPGCAPILPHVNQLDDADLPAASIDVGLMAHLDFFCYPDLLPASKRMIRSCLEALKPQGRMVVVQDMSVNPRGRPEYIQANFEEAGFRVVTRHQFQDPVVLFVFERPAAGE